VDRAPDRISGTHKVDGERSAVEAAKRPATVDSLAGDLRALGVAPGATLLVHSSLSRLGYVAGALLHWRSIASGVRVAG